MRSVLIILIVIFGCKQKEILTNNEILERSIQKHDPNNNLNKLTFKLRVQEPRISNPNRYSVVTLDNSNGTFEMLRNRDNYVSKHQIDKNERAITFLNDTIVKDSLLINKYRLQPERNKVYRRFYQTFSILPASLKNEKYQLNNTIKIVDFNGKKAYQIFIKLEKEIFSKTLHLYFDKENFKFLGLDILYPESLSRETERVIFDGDLTINNVTFSRYHHWNGLNGEYHGSDIFVKELK